MKPAKLPRRSSRVKQASGARAHARAGPTIAALRDLSASQVYARVLRVARAPAERAVRRVGLPSSDAEGVALEVAERAAGVGTPGLRASTPETPLLAWVCAAARRVAMEHRRFLNRADPRAAEAKELVRRLRRRAKRRELWGDLASRHAGRLLGPQRALLDAFLEGLTDDRIAQVAGLRRATVAERLWRIRRRLRHLAAGIEESPPLTGPLGAWRTLRGDAMEVARLRSEGRSYREIAHRMRRTQASVRSMAQRVRRAIQTGQATSRAS